MGQEMAELVIPPSLREAHREGLRRFLETGETKILGQAAGAHRHAVDGEEFPVELAVNRIAEADPPMFTGTIRDITDRAAGAGGARAGARTTRGDPSGRRGRRDRPGPDGRLLFANEAAVRTLGFSSTEDLLNAPIATILDRYDILDEDARPFPLEALPGPARAAG